MDLIYFIKSRICISLVMSCCVEPGFGNHTGLPLNSQTSAAVSVRRAQEYYSNKYLMKEEVLSIHYTVSNMCVCVFIRLPLSVCV